MFIFDKSTDFYVLKTDQKTGKNLVFHKKIFESYGSQKLAVLA
ncbi:hypothetical protein SAMN04487911_11478 [Arenibacter nanhaiticus]|uniref:Uncharacterized protein n=1 Tax=Arenibacter nanhaiticus TaxID=558155 RepID=A0A1M6HMP9_9FLAO|nr:hypothetical protein SAMN04487911_11478 [Arenibacter nanhaiticus]